jgi:Tfp pilus assembly protein PilV
MISTRDTRGFTLVSVIVAVVLLSFGLLALARAQTMLAVIEHNTANRGVAVAIATGYLEQLRARDPWTLTSEPGVAVNGQGQPASNGAFLRSTQVTLDNNNLVRIVVTVRYPRSINPIELQTLIYRS